MLTSKHNGSSKQKIKCLLLFIIIRKCSIYQNINIRTCICMIFIILNWNIPGRNCPQEAYMSNNLQALAYYRMAPIYKKPF